MNSVTNSDSSVASEINQLMSSLIALKSLQEFRKSLKHLTKEESFAS